MATVAMGLPEEWEDPVSLQRFLAAQLLQGRLMLVLGAGVSLAFGLPTWNELIRRLFESKGEAPPSTYGLERQAETFWRRYYKKDYLGFKAAVSSALYRDARVDWATLRRQAGLAAIGALVMSCSRASPASVITLNFDDLLELYLEYHGLVTVSLDGVGHWADIVDVSIYHPNGLLPAPGSGRRTSGARLVFDQSSFSKSIGRESDPVRQELVTLMRTHTCIFLGLSGADIGLDSILVDVKASHAASGNSHLFWGVRFTDSADEAERDFWEARGVLSVQGDYRRRLPGFLFGVCQMAAELRRHPPQ